jgi:hypothetical protein
LLQQPRYSVLRAWTLRPLPVALAHKLAVAKGDDSYMTMLRRLYAALPLPEQAWCQTELTRHAECMATPSEPSRFFCGSAMAQG